MADPADRERLHPPWRAGVLPEQDDRHRRPLLGFTADGERLIFQLL